MCIVAWVYGDNPCLSSSSNTFIVPSGQNPCGHTFTLANGESYYEENCGGGDIVLYNADGSGSHECTSADHTVGWNCEGQLQQTWVC
jgi:hypothetical protein